MDTTNVLDWDVTRVEMWLTDTHLPHLIPLFAKNEVDGITLINLTQEELREEVGIRSLGERKKVYENIQKLKFSLSIRDQAYAVFCIEQDARRRLEEKEKKKR
jgi:SAM domain (Sterile alpha motif)